MVLGLQVVLVLGLQGFGRLKLLGLLEGIQMPILIDVITLLEPTRLHKLLKVIGEVQSA